jgi:hypothetical protein
MQEFKEIKRGTRLDRSAQLQLAAMAKGESEALEFE